VCVLCFVCVCVYACLCKCIDVCMCEHMNANVCVNVCYIALPHISEQDVCVRVLVTRLSLKIEANSSRRSVSRIPQPAQTGCEATAWLGQASDCYVYDILPDTPAAICGDIQVSLTFLARSLTHLW